MRGRLAIWVMVAKLVTGVWSADAAPSYPSPTTRNVDIVGMRPTEIVRWSPLRETGAPSLPLVVIFAKEVTEGGESVLEEVLRTKHSIGIYLFDKSRQRWRPLWERITGELEVDFVEDYDLVDVDGDGREEVCVRIRYYGPNRTLDYAVKKIQGGKVVDLFHEKSLYQGAATASTGYVVVHQFQTENPEYRTSEIYAWSEKTGRLEKVREIRQRVTK